MYPEDYRKIVCVCLRLDVLVSYIVVKVDDLLQTLNPSSLDLMYFVIALPTLPSS